MTPRERDALVAEKVMGWSNQTLPNNEEGLPYYADYWVNENGIKLHPVNFWSPTEDISEAWEVVERFPLFEVKRVEIYIGYTHTECTCWTDVEKEETRSESETAPEAICLAALRAVGVEVQA